MQVDIIASPPLVHREQIERGLSRALRYEILDASSEGGPCIVVQSRTVCDVTSQTQRQRQIMAGERRRDMKHVTNCG